MNVSYKKTLPVCHFLHFTNCFVIFAIHIILFLSVHVCDREDNGGCSHKCEKQGKTGVCKCPEHMELKEDKKTCKPRKCVEYMCPIFLCQKN